MWPFTKKKTKRKLSKRSYYDSAAINRLTNDWTVTQSSPHDELKASLRILRIRSRDLARNNDYAKRYFKLVKTNVCGHRGIAMQSKVIESDGPDKYANGVIESAWKDWGKPGNCDVTGKLSKIDWQKLSIESLIRDGEVLIRKYQGRKHGKYQFKIRFLDPDLLDEEYNKDLKNGSRIEMGIEYNDFGAATAYHIFKKHPSKSLTSRERERVPAEQIIHAYDLERADQGRGVPFMVSTMLRQKNLAGYEEAEVVASRIGASKMGFFTSPDGDSYNGDDTEDGVKISEAEPGTFEQLPDGVQFQEWNPTHPTTAFKDFVKATLRGIASGLNVSYVDLANDLEGVSYSSIRKGELLDRDNWRMLQTWLIEHICTPIFEAWLENALMSQAINLPLRKYDKFNAPSWQPRGWSWVDPQKEVRANMEAVKCGFKSVSDVIIEQGKDPEETFARLAEDKALAEKYGLILNTVLEEVENDEY